MRFRKSAHDIIRPNILFSKKHIFPEGYPVLGYCVSCIGLDEKKILGYAEHQKKADKGQLQLAF